MPENLKYILFLCVFICCPLNSIIVSDVESQELPPKYEDTMLMFVGENLEVLSIASRRQESAWEAPAVAQVITAKELRERGVQTLSGALKMIPGFYMGQKEWGIQPYLRGIPDSVLFLYDTVPLGSDVTKSLNLLGYELSLAPVKRIEIVRGPASVLWGPDAFAGIVNIVPLSGKDIDGVETSILYGLPGNQEGVFLNAGYDTGLWDMFLSISGRRGEEDDTFCNITSFWENEITDEDVPSANRFGYEEPGLSHYIEALTRIAYEDVFTLSARISDNQKAYAMSDSEDNITWKEIRKTPLALVKMEAKKSLAHSSALRFTGFFSLLCPEYQIIDYILKQKEHTYYSELIYDRTLLAGRGLFTSGISYREKHIKNAPIWNSYLPDYLKSENQGFLPDVTEKSYNARLWSFFGQYRHKIGSLEVWTGLRNDNHDTYKDHTSFNFGASWSPDSRWIMKMLYGTAYRTPFAKQLVDADESELEKIKNIGIQLAWKPHDYLELEISGFLSRIENHIMEFAYAGDGLYLPNHQNIKGVEFDIRFSPSEDVELSSNLTLTDSHGPDETYRYDYTFWRPDGTVVTNYVYQYHEYDARPEKLFNVNMTWHPTEKWSMFFNLGYFSPVSFISPQDKTITSLPGAWLLDMSTTVQNVWAGIDLEFSMKNLTNEHYEIPGTYDIIEGRPFSAELLLKKRW